MRWACLTLIFLTGTIHCEEDSNEVVIGSSVKPPINLDSNLRKALLKALVELENEEKENHERSTRNDYVNIITHLDTKEKNVEKASASAISYFPQSEPVNMTITVKKSTSKPKHSVVVQKSKGTQHKTIYGVEDDLDLSESPEQIIASASSSFPSGKSNSGKAETGKVISGGARLNSVSSRGKTKRTKNQQTTTTVAPTSSTEESEANVESLQFFSAPLVAAFTVHQDDKGLPRRVEPIYSQAGSVTSTTEKQVEDLKTNKAELEKELLKQQRDLEARQEEELRNKQLKLEEEIKRLTKLKEEQERIIREQKVSYEQRLFEQHRKLLEEQSRLLNNVHPFVPITTTAKPILNSINRLNSNRNFRQNGGTVVAIQPSVGFVQPTVTSPLPLNGQILPVRNAVDFRTPFPRSLDQQLIIQNSITPDIRPIIPSQPVFSFANTAQNVVLPFGNVPLVNTAQNPIVHLNSFAPNNDFLQRLPSVVPNTNFRQFPSATQTFTTTQSLPFTSSQIPSFRPPEPISQAHGTRSLRQETGTGNFVNHNRLNSHDNSVFGDHRFNRNPFASQPLFRPNFVSNTPSFSQYNTLQYSVDSPFLNQRLNNLLLSSGVSRGKQQEDLNIVSKVLSLNHLGGDIHTANSNVADVRTRAPANWRVV